MERLGCGQNWVWVMRYDAIAVFLTSPGAIIKKAIMAKARTSESCLIRFPYTRIAGLFGFS
jgi:hypothetical protein